MKSPIHTLLATALASSALIALPAIAQDNQGAGQSGASSGGQSGADIQVQQPAPEITVQQPAPEVTVTQPEPTVTIEQPKPNVTVEQQGQPDVNVQEPGRADVTVQQGSEAQNAAAQPQDGDASATAAGGAMADNNPLYGMRGSEIIGQNVYGAAGEEIGEIDNVVVSREADRSPAAIIGVGGFLGLGERNVAVSLDRLRMEQDRLVTDLTRDEIAGMQAYDENNWDSWEADRPINEAMNR